MTEKSITGRDFGRLEEKVDHLVRLIEADVAKHESLEPRVRAVEHKQYWFSGAAVVVGALFTYLLPHRPGG